jgi:hypothetical protein
MSAPNLAYERGGRGMPTGEELVEGAQVTLHPSRAFTGVP